MPANILTAKDAIYAAFNDAWIAGTPAICGYVPEIRWGKQEQINNPPTSLHWAWVNMQTVDERQSSLSSHDKKFRYRSDGLIIVQLFFSKSTIKGQQADQLADLAKKSFIRSVANDAVWFRNSTKQDLAAEESWFRTNVTARWTYDEII